MMKNLSEKDIDKTNEKNEMMEFLSDFIQELGSFLKNMEEKTFVVDRIENEIAVCEDRDNKEIVEIPVKKLPQGICDGTVIVEKNGQYKIDKEKQAGIEKIIDEKMRDIWK